MITGLILGIDRDPVLVVQEFFAVVETMAEDRTTPARICDFAGPGDDGARSFLTRHHYDTIVIE